MKKLGSVLVDTGEVRVFDAANPSMIVELRSGLGDGLYDVRKDGAAVEIDFWGFSDRRPPRSIVEWTTVGTLEAPSGELVFVDPCHRFEAGNRLGATAAVKPGTYDVLVGRLPTDYGKFEWLRGMSVALRLQRQDESKEVRS